MIKVLAIDDDVWQLDLYRRELTEAGFRVEVAQHGYEAIQQTDILDPDVIVLDLQLPGSNGVAFLHELRSHADLARIPVILNTLLPIKLEELKPYGVVALHDKSTVKTAEIVTSIRKAIP